MEHQPVKRSKYLMALSKDHHAGLLFCWKIKEGLKRDTEARRIKKYINFFWGSHLKEHFKEEEEWLFNRADDPLCQQAKAEHRLLAQRLNQLNDKKEEYAEFTELLIKHIRFEERAVFPRLEAILPVAILNEIGQLLDRQHPTPFKDEYADEFWLNKNNKAG